MLESFLKSALEILFAVSKHIVALVVTFVVMIITFVVMEIIGPEQMEHFAGFPVYLPVFN